MRTLILILGMALLFSCQSNKGPETQVIFLHHSTGGEVWLGSTNHYLYKLTRKGDVEKYISKYNKNHSTNYEITSEYFPKEEPYGWENYPFDYYNIWVKNAGNTTYMEEPTLELLTQTYDVIIFKHCYPVGNILEDTGIPDIDSNQKRVENYKLQYNALKEKMHEFPDNKFIVWTPAAMVKMRTSEEQAIRTREFYNWVLNEWDEKGDNIYIWDFYKLETEGGLYLKEENAVSPDNSHPGKDFSGRAAPLFAQLIIDCIEGLE